MAHDTCGDFFGIAGLTGDLICLPLHGEHPIGQSFSPLCDCDGEEAASLIVRLVHTLLPMWVACLLELVFCSDSEMVSPVLSSPTWC